MSETPVDKSIDRKSNVVMFTFDQSQPDDSFVHNLLQDRPSTSLADELDITEKRPALRLQMQPGSSTFMQSKKFSTGGAWLFQGNKTKVVMFINVRTVSGRTAVTC